MLGHQRTHGLFIVSLMLLSVAAIGLTVPAPVAAANETSNGTITGTEVWQGSHTVSGDVTVAPGAKLIVQAGTQVTFANGTALEVQGNLCIGVSSCGATAASAGNPVTFQWANPVNNSMNGRCYIAPVWNRDPSCGEGIVVRNSVDLAETKFAHLRVNNAYGFPDVLGIAAGQIRYGAVVLDGASVEITEPTFQNINTSNILVLDLAAPQIRGGDFVVGTDADGYLGSAIVAYGAGTSLAPLSVTNATFSGATAGCSEQDDGRSVLFTEESFVNVADNTVAGNDFGFFFSASAGLVSTNDIDVDCNAIDVNARREVAGTSYKLTLFNNDMAAGGSGLTIYDESLVHAEQNTITAGDTGSGVQLKSSEARLTGNHIGPVTGFNGIWSVGEGGDYVIDNNTIDSIPRTAIVLNEYRFRAQTNPGSQRAHIANNTITNLSADPDTCAEDENGNDPFLCPAIHVFLASATIKDNTIASNAGRGIMITGGIADVQRNVVEANDFFVRVHDFDNNYGTRFSSIGYFAENAWQNTTGLSNVSQVYNITKSRVSIQSENIPGVAAAHGLPIWLAWEGSEFNHNVSLPLAYATPPQTFPLAVDLIRNATTLTYADVTFGQGVSDLDRSQIYIRNQDSAWGVQVQKGELMRLRVRSNAGFEGGAAVSIKNPYGLELYNTTTNVLGYTPRMVLPSDFHLDTNWNHAAVDAGENSCADGVDNDGDTLADSRDPDCQGGGRELAVYQVWTFKWGKGIKQYEFNLTGEVNDIVTLENIAPTISVSQSNGTSFRRVINATGTARDGIAGPYFDDYDAWWKQGGKVTEVRIKDPFTSTWNDARFATDASMVNEPQRLEWPFDSWYREFDFATEAEDDYVFEFRAYDGVNWSNIETRNFKLNTEPPTVQVNTPVSGSFHDSGVVQFSGSAADSYAGAQGSDIKKIWFDIQGPEGYSTLTPTTGSTSWSYTWNFSALPSGNYTFTIWASDSNFCDGIVDECTPVTVTIEVENLNSAPVVQLLEPIDGSTITAGPSTRIAGIAWDPDDDGEVRRIDLVVTDLQSNLPLPGSLGPVTNILPNGAWELFWDTGELPHDFRYRIDASGFDGYDYGLTASATITISNPADRDNNPPTFVGAEWPTQVTAFCDYASTSLDRCGEGGELNLTRSFFDLDVTDTLSFSVLDDDQTAADDLHQLITIDAKGVAHYNPLDMIAYTANIGEWSQEGVVFVAYDGKTRAYSNPVDFIVRSINFTADRTDSGIVDEDGATYTGTGRPGEVVTAYHQGKQIPLESAIVDDNGTWTITIPLSDLSEGSNEIVFRYGGQEFEEQSLSRAVSDDGGFPWWLWLVLIVIMIGVLGGLFFFFFVEFEEEDEVDPLDQTTMVAAQQAAQAYAAPQAAAPAAATPAPTAPGWRWDAAQNQWVPDGSGQPPQPPQA